MASNVTEIADAINNLNATFEAIDVNNIVPTAIQETNNSTNGWLGFTVLIIFSIAVLAHILSNKAGFQIFDRLGIALVSLSIILDLGIQLLIFGILPSVQVYVFIYVSFFVVAVISFLKKEMLSVDT